jgi:hypothetical protein
MSHHKYQHPKARVSLSVRTQEGSILLILFGFLLLILAGAVGVLFAMCAELSRRIASSPGDAPHETLDASAYVRPVDRPNVFLRPNVIWPSALDELRSRDTFLLLVLSTACTTCNTVGREVGRDWTTRAAGRLGVVISTPDIARGEAFVAEYHLDKVSHFIDEDGSWTNETFGLSLSPVGLVFSANSLQSSYVFNHMEPLWRSFTKEISWVSNASQNNQPHNLPAEDSSAPSARAV